MNAIDHAHLDAQTFGDRDLARDLLALFSDQCGRILPSLSKGALPVQDRADLAHALKGSAASVGATTVRALAAQVEDALREGAPAEATLSDLAAAVAAARAEIDPTG